VYHSGFVAAVAELGYPGLVLAQVSLHRHGRLNFLGLEASQHRRVEDAMLRPFLTFTRIRLVLRVALPLLSRHLTFKL
jgi:hypothetical protein